MSTVSEQIEAMIPACRRFLTPKELAEITGIEEQRLRHWRHVKSAGPSYVKMGQAVRYPREAVLKWMKSNAVEIGGEHPETKTPAA